MATKKFPKKSLILNVTDPLIQLMVINTLKQAGFDVYEETTGFDPDFPYLYWSSYVKNLSQTKSNHEAVSLNEFMKAFGFGEPSVIEVKLNDSYVAKVSEKHIQVGCQTISHKALEEVYKASRKIQGK